MGRMKDLLITIYNGGDEAVEAAQQIAGLSEIVPHDDEPGWIPVEERLPEDGQNVIACFVGGTEAKEVGEATFNKREGWFSTEHGAWSASHWMPMPEPPAQ